MLEENRRYDDGLRDGKALAVREEMDDLKESTQKKLDKLSGEFRHLRIALIGNGEKDNCIVSRLVTLETEVLFSRKLIFSLFALIMGLAVTAIFT